MRNLWKILIGKKFAGKASSGMIYVVLVMLGIGLMSISLTNGPFPSKNPVITNPPVTPVEPTVEQGKENLQLYTFGYTTPAPTIAPKPTTPPTTSCGYDAIKTAGCGACPDFDALACDEPTCSKGYPKQPLGADPFGKQYCVYIKANDEALYQSKKSDPNCLEACIAKPVIYLYPIIPTLVDVAVKVPGRVIISDPLYPEAGWKNVLANPNGSLIYKNQKYKELFYETDVDKVNAPDNGIVIAKADLQQKLTEATSKLGLNKPEQDEFLEYWVPRLTGLNSPYILFSIIDQSEKERIDHVDITPKPDTFIGFIAYFKPLNSKPINLKPLILPANPQARIGFTAVEWGGTIDY
ncbi:MAG TPA: hypothetical protein VLG67_02770 [Candidatus Saccharimonadales bacterium]|nr:hypothetical protein [Candidatus Saccharimonadales bacterium]